MRRAINDTYAPFSSKKKLLVMPRRRLSECLINSPPIRRLPFAVLLKTVSCHLHLVLFYWSNIRRAPFSTSIIRTVSVMELSK